jgi:[acyl-carrier-protein] S-malonyltransferase
VLMKLAFVFPGQGSQSVGMLNGFGDNAAVRAAMQEASAALGQDLSALIAAGSEEELGRTVNTQPLMLAANVASYRAWLAAGGAVPSVMAGHSLGEYAALCAAGSFALADATKLVRFRAQAMQSAVPEGVGAMAAILGLADADVIAACKEAEQGEVAEAVNFNAPSQVVIAGHRAAVERAIEIAKAKGAKRGVLLPVSAPFHSSLLLPAAQELERFLSKIAISAPQVLVIHNVDVSYAGTPDQIRAALSKQAASAVRWVETIQKMADTGVTHIVECGPGKVLSGLIKRIAPQVSLHNINDTASLEATLNALKSS